MTAESAVLAGRVAAEALMVDACIITRAGAGDPTFNSTTGEYTAPAGSTVYAGPCQVQLVGLTSQVRQVGERQITIDTVVVKIPTSVTTVSVDDLVTITGSLLDQALVGRQYVVADDFAKTYATARRLRCAEVTS